MTLLAGFKVLLAPPRRPGRRGGRLAERRPPAGGDRGADRLLPQHPGAAHRPLAAIPTFRELLARVRRGGRWGPTAPGRPLREAAGGAAAGARAQPHPALPGAVQHGEPAAPARLELPGAADRARARCRDPDAKFDLTLYVEERDGRIDVDLVYNADLFDAPRMEELLRAARARCWQAGAGDPEPPIGALSLVTPASARSLLPDPAPAAERASGWARSTSGSRAQRGADPGAAGGHRSAAARSGPTASWTRAANQLARVLRAGGVETGDVVAVWAHRGAALVAGRCWATLKAGAAFMILDPAYPAARLLDDLRIGRPAAWLAVPERRRRRRRRRPAAGPRPRLRLELRGRRRRRLAWTASPADATPAVAGRAGRRRPASPSPPARPARPRGSSAATAAVPLPPLAWASASASAEADRFSLLSGLAHDPLQRDLFTPLWFGAALCVPDPGASATPGWLAGWMAREGVTVAHLTPAMLELLAAPRRAAGGGEALPALRLAFVVGDVLTRRDVARCSGWPRR